MRASVFVLYSSFGPYRLVCKLGYPMWKFITGLYLSSRCKLLEVSFGKVNFVPVNRCLYITTV